MDMNLSKLHEKSEDRGAWRAAVHGVAELDMTEWLNNIIKRGGAGIWDKWILRDMDFTCVSIAAVEVMTVSMYEPASSIPWL